MKELPERDGPRNLPQGAQERCAVEGRRIVGRHDHQQHAAGWVVAATGTEPASLSDSALDSTAVREARYDG